MQPIKQLTETLARLANTEHFLFSLSDLTAITPELSPAAFKALVGRAVKAGVLRRVCRGLYLYPRVEYPAGLLLYYAAARLRAQEFNYISLESVLSDVGVISQIPMSWVTIMSSGRSNIIDCGNWGHIEFIHTKKVLKQVEEHIHYDSRCRMWRASVALALRDMALTRRSTDLIDMELTREFV